MRFHVSCRIFLGLFFLLQLSEAGEKDQEKLALFMQRNVEQLIEKILSQVQEYYHEIKSNAKCIPDYVPDNIMMTLKKSIDCVSENEKNYISGKIRRKAHMKNFLNCFSQAKREVNETMMAIDPEEDYCPENVTEKTYQINVTTTFVKTFQISISNGLEVTHKEIDFSKDNCADKISDKNENEEGDNTTPSIYSTDVEYFENTSDASTQNEDVGSTVHFQSSDGFDDDEVSSTHHQNDLTSHDIFTHDDVDSSTHHQTDDNFDEDSFGHDDNITSDHQNDGSFDISEGVTHDDTESPADVRSTINSYSTYVDNGKPLSTTETRSTQEINDFTEIYNFDSDNPYYQNNIYPPEDHRHEKERQDIAKYQESQYEDNQEGESLDEYSFDYDGPEENEENTFNEYEENNSDEYNMDNPDFEPKPKQKNETNNGEKRGFHDSYEHDQQKKAALSNAGRKTLASDIYTQLKKLREEDDYYDIKNGGKLGFKSENEDFDEEGNGRNEKKKRRTKNHPEKLKKYVNGRTFVKNS